MRPWIMRQTILALLLLAGAAQPASEPIVRIGLVQNAATVTVRSASDFVVEQRTTRTATFASALAIDPAATGALKTADLQHRMTVTIDGGIVLVPAPGTRVRIQPPAAPLEI